MLLAGLFLAAFARSFASPVPIASPAGPISSPLCVVAAALTTCACDTGKRRSLFDIIYSCLGVILLCTYVSVHQNIPDQGHSWARILWTKLKTTIYAIFAPELVILWALRQRIAAGRIANQNKHRGWTITHGFFVQMGGLVLVVKEDVLQPEDKPEDEKGLMDTPVSNGLTYRVIVPNDNLCRLPMPQISEREIKALGKGDLLVKAIFAIQTTWFVLQCIARHIQNLGLTEIELTTLAFAIVNFIAYILWWYKPLNVDYPIYIDDKGSRVDGPVEDICIVGLFTRVSTGFKGCYKSIGAGISAWARNLWSDTKKNPLNIILHLLVLTIVAPLAAILSPLTEMADGHHVDLTKLAVVPSFYAAPLVGQERVFARLWAAVIGVVFGGIHLIGWNFQPSTLSELWLWRACSLVLIIIPAFFATTAAFRIAHGKAPANSTSLKFYEFIFDVFGTLEMLTMPFYLIARIIILVLAILALRSLPDSAYQNVEWLNFIPHI